MFKLFRAIRRISRTGSEVEYNPGVLDYMPKGGLVGYSTNNPQLALLLLSEPAERFNFHVKDFSRLSESLNFEQKALAAGADQRDLSFDDMYGRNVHDSGDVYNCNTVFTHAFPRNIEEAKLLEQKDGGVNLFMHIEFEESVGRQWDTEDDAKVLECKCCGKVVKVTPEISDEQSHGSQLTQNKQIGEVTNCNLDSALCEWKSGNLNAKGNERGVNEESDELSDLHSYFDDRGLFVRFRVKSDMELNKARVELLRNVAGGFKL